LHSAMSALIPFLENHSQKCQTITLITNWLVCDVG
jgi:hypothetical protein